MNDRRGLSAIALLLVACSSSPSQNPYLPPTGAGGTGGSGTAGPSGTVAVAFLSPPTPSSGSTLASNSDLPISVTVDIVGGNDFVAAGSVKATLTATGATAPAATGQLVAASADIFTGTVSLGSLKVGSYTLVVAATSSGGAVGQASIGIVIDDGPAVSVSSPVAGKSYNGSLTVEFTADFGAIGPSATGPNPSATVGGLPVQGLMVDSSPNVPPNSYRGTVTFDAYSPPLTGVQLLDVKATNANGVLTEVRVLFGIDNTGPTITLTTPTPGEVVGGVIDISATITDSSGILDSSVIAIIGDQNNTIFNLPLAPEGAGVYGVIFDTANLTRCPEPPATDLCLVYPTISLRASDTLGNQTVLGYDFSVDNIAPVADFDPPPVRDERLGANGYECSFAFDPLSLNRYPGDMPNDGCLVPQVFDLRARIEDDGNRASGLKIVPIAGIDPNNTSVYVLHDIGQPLVVDSNGDGSCDEINPLLVPTTDPPTAANQVLKIRLAGVPPAGTANFEPDPTLVGNPNCVEGSASTPPPLLCNSEQPTIAISYAGDEPAVWSVEPIDATFRCLGNQFDSFANNIPEGWACLAIQTVDLVGNKGVSVPLRVYIQYHDAGGFCGSPPAGAGPPPTCTGTFTGSADPTIPGVAALGACSARKFTGTDYCYLGDCPGPLP